MSYMPPIKSDVHLTPDIVWDIIKEGWGYEQNQFFDPCPVNPKWNGLEIKWKELNYVNPPYSKQSGDKKSLLTLFVEKALEESGTTIMLLPSKTDQEWFHTLVKNNYKIHWIRGRIKFKDQTSSIQIPCFLVEIA